MRSKILVSTFCILASAFLLAGCASIRQPTPFGDATARTFCKDVELPKMLMSNSVSNAVSNQTLTVEGYKSGVNVKAIEAIGAACGIAVGNALRAAGMVP